VSRRAVNSKYGGYPQSGVTRELRPALKVRPKKISVHWSRGRATRRLRFCLVTPHLG